MIASWVLTDCQTTFSSEPQVKAISKCVFRGSAGFFAVPLGWRPCWAFTGADPISLELGRLGWITGKRKCEPTKSGCGLAGTVRDHCLDHLGCNKRLRAASPAYQRGFGREFKSVTNIAPSSVRVHGNCTIGRIGWKPGRNLRRLPLNRTRATGWPTCGYGIAPGHADWLNRDPIFEEGGINVYAFVRNRPVSWIDPDGLKFDPTGPDAKKWSELLECWKNTLPENSLLKSVVKELSASKRTVTITPLTGKKDTGGKQVKIPYGEPSIFDNRTIYTDYGTDYHWNADPDKELYVHPETFVHEMLHAHDQIIKHDPRGHSDTFWDDEKRLRQEARNSKCR
jgi:hypothetical protein